MHLKHVSKMLFNQRVKIKNNELKIKRYILQHKAIIIEAWLL